MSEITSNEYWKEINELAESIAQDAMGNNDNDRGMAEEEINDYRLHETIDGHQWIIYYAYNLDVIKYSSNTNYMTDNFGNDEAGSILKEKGLDSLHSAIAFWAMYADVQDQIQGILDRLEEEKEDLQNDEED